MRQVEQIGQARSVLALASTEPVGVGFESSDLPTSCDMERQKVVSREYKIMLRPKLFAGAEKSLVASAQALSRDVSEQIGTVALGVTGGLSRIKTRRLITFLDTRTHHLNRAHYIFRERRDGSKREVTLKFRHPDRFLAQARDMHVKKFQDAKTKFEEDIKAPFVSLHSFSTTVEVDDRVTFAQLRDVMELFPDLSGRIAGSDDEPLQVVNDFTARELVLNGANAQIGKTPRVDAEWALIVWYDERKNAENPVAVELSFRYGDKNEEYGGGVTRRAADIFNAIQSELGKWVDPKPRTKTAFVFQ